MVVLLGSFTIKVPPKIDAIFDRGNALVEKAGCSLTIINFSHHQQAKIKSKVKDFFFGERVIGLATKIQVVVPVLSTDSGSQIPDPWIPEGDCCRPLAQLNIFPTRSRYRTATLQQYFLATSFALCPQASI
jgi:hypothetical protein